MIRESTDQTFLGKVLVRKNSGRIILTGVFEVPNIDDFDDGDEMWVCRLVLDEALKHIKYKGREGSPEDFLMNIDGLHDPNNWSIKPNYNRTGRG
jgi:hypothetical protein